MTMDYELCLFNEKFSKKYQWKIIDYMGIFKRHIISLSPKRNHMECKGKWRHRCESKLGNNGIVIVNCCVLENGHPSKGNSHIDGKDKYTADLI